MHPHLRGTWFYILCIYVISVFLRSTLRWRRDEGTLRVWVSANSVRTSIGVVYCGYVIINHYFLPLIKINIVFQISWICLLLLGKMRRLLAVLEILELQSLVNDLTTKSRIALILTRRVSNLVIRLWHFSLMKSSSDLPCITNTLPFPARRFRQYVGNITGFETRDGSWVRVRGVRVRVAKLRPSPNPYPQDGLTGFRGFFHGFSK